MLVLGPDGKSVRVFSRRIGDNILEFYGRKEANGTPWRLLDFSLLSEWDLDRCALNGNMQGQCLTRVEYLKDYWFDWQHYHPNTGIYRH